MNIASLSKSTCLILGRQCTDKINNEDINQHYCFQTESIEPDWVCNHLFWSNIRKIMSNNSNNNENNNNARKSLPKLRNSWHWSGPSMQVLADDVMWREDPAGGSHQVRPGERTANVPDAGLPPVSLRYLVPGKRELEIRVVTNSIILRLA